jgi:hypothetical protein
MLLMSVSRISAYWSSVYPADPTFALAGRQRITIIITSGASVYASKTLIALLTGR